MKEFEGVLAHHDAHVVLSFCEQTVRIDKLEPDARFERVPLMDVAVNKHGAFVVVCIDATFRTCERMIDGLLRTGTVELLPAVRNEVDQPLALLGAGWQTTLGRRTPDASSRHTENLVPLLHWEPDLLQGPAEPLDQQRAPNQVVPQQAARSLGRS